MRGGKRGWFRKEVKGREVMEQIALESLNKETAPRFVPIPAELAEHSLSTSSTASPGLRAPSPPPSGEKDGVRGQALFAADGSRKGQGADASSMKGNRVLIVGGGSSHDFDRWFNQEDSKILSAAGRATVTYTDKPDDVQPALR